MIRKGTAGDIDAVERTYTELLTYEQDHTVHSFWKLGVYPTRSVAENGVKQGWLYVLEEQGEICASMLLNQFQPDEYRTISWHYEAADEETLVLHTLCIPPSKSRHGYGKQMVQFAIDEGKRRGCKVLRLDTNSKNEPAATLYRNMGFSYAGTCPATLQGLIPIDMIFFDYPLLS